MRRCLTTLVIVTALAGLIARAEQSGGRARHPEWVRTVDGWERRSAVDARYQAPLPVVHPGLVALVQLGSASLALVAFPSRARGVTAASPSRVAPIAASERLALRRPKLTRRTARVR